MSHLSCIGFHSESDEALRQLAMQAFEQAQPIPVGSDFYMYYRDDSGAELWLQFDKQKNLIGLNPHFDVVDSWEVCLTALVEDAQSRMDGSFFGVAFPSVPGDVDSGLFPLFFDTPDFAQVQNLSFPADQEVWICAFARSIDIIKSEDVQDLTSNFYPSGLYLSDGEVSPNPQAFAEITAAIISTNLVTNHLTNQPFYVLQVDIHSRILNVVADPTLVNDLNPEPGDWIKGEFWLSGRLKNSLISPQKESWWKKFMALSRNRD